MRISAKSLVYMVCVLAVGIVGWIMGLATVYLLGEILHELAGALEYALEIDWRALRMEFSARSPELASLIIGQVLILAFVLLARNRIEIGAETAG